MVKGVKSTFRCRDCDQVFTLRSTPKRARIVKCPKCGSDDVEFATV